jgi:hypothetical protein
MELQIFNCAQGTPEWFACRLGIPTASKFATVMASGRGGGESKTRRTYMLTLIGEEMTGIPSEGFSNSHTERGHEMEPDARNLYSMIADVEPMQVGFLRRGNVGASPDSLIGDQGMLEIKTKLPHLQLDCLLDDKLPAEHVAQCQGQMWVAQRQWLDFVSYWPGLPLFVKRVHRDEKYIAGIKIAIDDFLADMAALKAQIINHKRAA